MIKHLLKGLALILVLFILWLIFFNQRPIKPQTEPSPVVPQWLVESGHDKG